MDWKLDDGRPIWPQLAQLLTRRIIAGIYPPGSLENERRKLRMKKKAVSLALALAVCLGLTVPALADQYGPYCRAIAAGLLSDPRDVRGPWAVSVEHIPKLSAHGLLAGFPLCGVNWDVDECLNDVWLSVWRANPPPPSPPPFAHAPAQAAGGVLHRVRVPVAAQKNAPLFPVQSTQKSVQRLPQFQK